MSEGLIMKYFVLNPGKGDAYGEASREAMAAYALAIQDENPDLYADLQQWLNRIEADKTQEVPFECEKCCNYESGKANGPIAQNCHSCGEFPPTPKPDTEVLSVDECEELMSAVSGYRPDANSGSFNENADVLDTETSHPMEKYFGMLCEYRQHEHEPWRCVSNLSEIDSDEITVEYVDAVGNPWEYCRPHSTSVAVLELRKQIRDVAEIVDLQIVDDEWRRNTPCSLVKIQQALLPNADNPETKEQP